MTSKRRVQRLRFNDNGKVQSLSVQENLTLHNGTVPEWVLEKISERQPTSVADTEPQAEQRFPPCDKVELIPRGNVYKMMRYMWDRKVASYDELEGPVFDYDPPPQSIRTLLSKTNVVLLKIGERWTLHADSVSRVVTKRNRKNP